jgi:4-amino-4-deoxy-L-arabinose transferase-like glycosyltransferase
VPVAPSPNLSLRHDRAGWNGPARRLAALPTPALFLLAYAAVALAHLTLLRLPYFWDEGGYYIPAALDFYRHGALIPTFTNAHPPLPNVVLGTLWHVTGLSILATRLCACAFAAAGLVAVFRLTQRLLSPAAAYAVTLLTAVYPIWFAQSSMAHADIFAAAFTLWALAIYIPARTRNLIAPNLVARSSTEPLGLTVATLFALAALAKETAIVIPAALATYELTLLLRDRRNRTQSLGWIAALSFPLLPLLSWYAFHHARTGFTFGNPEYLRYNATANFTLRHVLYAMWQRFLHLTWQRNLWLPIVLAAACFLLPERPRDQASRLPRSAWHIIAVLLVAQWLAFSVLGGALLTRYLLPAFPLVLIACVSVWQSRTERWPWLAAATAAAFIAGWWLSPPFAFAPEDNLTYRDMVVVHQEAIDYVATHLPGATVLTAWPVTTDMNKPELGYVSVPLKVVAVEDFTLPTMLQTAQDPGRFDTAIIFSRHYAPPTLQQYWATHPNSRRGREFAEGADLKPREVAALLGGTILWQDDRNGEWAAVLHFPRSYEARLR